MKRTGNKNLKIAAATMMTIFSLFTCFSGAMAWFIGLRQQDSDVNDFAVNSLDGKLKNIYFHKVSSTDINPTTLTPNSYTFSSSYSGKISYNWTDHTASYTGDTSISLPNYSPLDQYHPLLIVFEFNDLYESFEDGDIYIIASTEVEGFLGERESDNTPTYDLKTNGVYYSKPNSEDPSKTDYFYALSSVADFLCNDSSTELYNKDASGNNTSLINTTYNISDLRTRDMSIAAKEEDDNAVVPDLSFTSINNSDETTSFKQNPYIYMSKANTSVRYVSIVVDYYADAVEYIYSTYLGNTTLETEFHSELHFLCDWGMEVY